MNIPGLLIEYLIGGLILLLSLFLLTQHASIITKFGNGLLVIPIAYILGMIIDMFAYLFIRLPKKHIRKKAINTLDKSFLPAELTLIEAAIADQLKMSGYTDYITTKLYAANLGELVKEINWRSSRDRIARGMIINAPVLVFAATNFLMTELQWVYKLVMALGSMLVFFIIWWHSELMSTRFQMRAFAQVILRQDQK